MCSFTDEFNAGTSRLHRPSERWTGRVAQEESAAAWDSLRYFSAGFSKTNYVFPANASSALPAAA